jgi:hypothetical protein
MHVSNSKIISVALGIPYNLLRVVIHHDHSDINFAIKLTLTPQDLHFDILYRFINTVAKIP